METKFTKGEWKIERGRSGFEDKIITDKGVRIAEVKSYGKGFKDATQKERVSNSKLIAAAPDMSEALSAMIRIKDIYMPSDINEVRPEHYDEMTVLFKAFGQMEEVIKKATK